MTECTNPTRVLIADDNHDAAATLAILVQHYGKMVEVANDGQEAFAKAKLFRPHIAILDLGMPGLSGYQVCRAIRSLSWARDTVLIALTGWSSSHHRALSARAGFDRHFAKPLDPNALSELDALYHRALEARRIERSDAATGGVTDGVRERVRQYAVRQP